RRRRVLSRAGVWLFSSEDYFFDAVPFSITSPQISSNGQVEPSEGSASGSGRPPPHVVLPRGKLSFWAIAPLVSCHSCFLAYPTRLNASATSVRAVESSIVAGIL